MQTCLYSRRSVLVASATALAGVTLSSKNAFSSPDPVRIGIIDDLTGPNSGNSGPGTVEAARMAIEDIGGKIADRPVELLIADDQNKPDIAVSIAREWFAEKGVSLITGLASSNSALAVQAVARQANRLDIVTAAATADLTGPQCSPNGIHWMSDTYTSAASLVDIIVRDGGKRWFFITVDVAFGKSMEQEATRIIQKAGGTVLGSVRHPLGENDFSSAIISAQSSGADVIALAQAGADLDNTIKAMHEFGTLNGHRQLAVFFLQTAQVQSLGQEATQGLITPTVFFPDMNAQTRTWTERFVKRSPTGRVPTTNQVNAYCAVTHYLKAVTACGTTDANKVMAQMKQMPVNDMTTQNGRIREDGTLIRPVFVVQVKSPAESSGPFDYFRLVATVPPAEAYRPLSQQNCPYVT